MVNMDGDKLPPIVIGNAKRPRAFKRINVNQTFNIKWESNKTSWMTGRIFTDYFTKLDDEMRQQNRKILVFLDNAACHPDMELQNIKMIFFPPNTTSKLQPMDQGIIQ